MPKPTLPAFDPADLAESNATSYPEKFRAANSGRWNRRLGDHVGLTNFGVNLTRIVPGAQSSARHAHSRQDEFIWVVSGEIVLETNEGAQTLRPGMCAGFPAGCGNAHRFVNRSADGRRAAGDRRPHAVRRGHLSRHRQPRQGRRRRPVRPHAQGRHAALTGRPRVKASFSPRRRRWRGRRRAGSARRLCQARARCAPRC